MAGTCYSGGMMIGLSAARAATSMLVVLAGVSTGCATTNHTRPSSTSAAPTSLSTAVPTRAEPSIEQTAPLPVGNRRLGPGTVYSNCDGRVVRGDDLAV